MKRLMTAIRSILIQKKVILILLLSLALFAYLFFVNYCRALGDYILTLAIFIIAILIAWQIRARWTKGKYQDDLFLASFAIFLTVGIFILQNLQSIEDVYDTLQSANKYNCSVAKDLIKEITATQQLNNVSPRIRRRYSAELYKTNMGFLLKKFDGKESEIVFETIGNMEEANRFLDLSLANAKELPRNLIDSNEKSNILTQFDIYANVGKIYDNQTLDLTRKVFSGLKEIDSKLGAHVSGECK